MRGLAIRAVRTHLLLWHSCFLQAVRRDLQFRSQAVLTLVSSLLELGLGVIPVLILTRDAGSASGWTGPTAVAVVGLFGVGSGLIDCFVAPNLRRIDTSVRRGDLDLILIRPVNAWLYSALRWAEPAELGRVLVGLGLFVAALSVGGIEVSGRSLGVALAWAAVGVVGFSLLWANLVYLAFWVESAEPMSEIALQVREVGKYPLVYFPRPVQLIATSLVPAGLVAAVPVGVLVGQAGPLWLTVIGLCLATAVTALHWRVALRRYNSASS